MKESRRKGCEQAARDKAGGMTLEMNAAIETGRLSRTRGEAAGNG
jgi:hypothetical protein